MIKKLILYTCSTFLFIELLFGYFYFQKSWEKGSSIKWLASRLNEKYIQKELISPEVPNIFNYAYHLKTLIEEVKGEKINIIMLYIPMVNTSDEALISKRDFFKEQARINNISFVDTTKMLRSYPEKWIYNQPFDSHLSRFGHIQVSDIILKKIKLVFDIKKKVIKVNKVNKVINNITGPHPENVDSVNRYNQLGYRVQTNSQGFRMLYGIQPNKESIIILGDSFTYGTGVNTFESYPNILNRLLKDINIINAGIPGTSIIEQSRYFKSIKDKAIINTLILQVLDNDIKS